MSNQLIPVFQQYFNANGVAQAGLKLHTYITGTLNDKETFQTFGGTANANPIILDASGYPPAGIYGSGTYRFVLKDAEGVTLKDQDQIILTAGLQPDENGDYLIPDNLDIEGSLTVDDMVITADGTAIWTLGGTEIMRTDASGNSSLNGATIESGLNTSYNFVFKNDSCMMNSKTNDTTFECVNCYMIVSGLFNFLDTDRHATIKMMSNGLIGEYIIDKSVGNGFTFSAHETKLSDVSGGIFFPKMKTGTTQGGAGAAAGELWSDTDDDNTIKLGV